MSLPQRIEPGKRIKDRLYRPALILLTVFGILLVAGTNIVMKQIAYREAYQLSQVLASQNLAVHTFVNQEQKPTFFKAAAMDTDDFLPELMSSTYMIRRINKYLDPYIPVSYYYKEVAVNARSPENEAQYYEVDILEQFKNGEITEVEKTITWNDQKYFVYMRAGEVMEEGCLICHGDPAQAPAGLISYYGSQRSFGREPGELVSALSIRIPVEEAYAHANRTSMLLSLAYLSMLALLFGSVSSILSRVVLQPVAVLDERVRTILGRFSHEAGQTALDGDELQNVNTVFTFLEEKLTAAYDSL